MIQKRVSQTAGIVIVILLVALVLLLSCGQSTDDARKSETEGEKGHSDTVAEVGSGDDTPDEVDTFAIQAPESSELGTGDDELLHVRRVDTPPPDLGSMASDSAAIETGSGDSRPQ